ncbi:MAG: YafY family protein [Acidobacteriota bacterium]|nr:YafY family protein [Acidobacteriota bacterium]
MTRRADRLFQIIQILRRGRLTTARFLSETLEVSERTIYRDIRDLVLSGVPLEGEAGLGYIMKKGFDLPPLMFDYDELEALLVGTRLLHGWADPKLARAADRALQKILNVLPQERRDGWRRTPIFAPQFRADAMEIMTPVRAAVNEYRKLRLDYARADGTPSQRTIRPLGLFFWGRKWTVVGWCELREGFRQFRLDRIASIEVLAETFRDEAGKTLNDFFELEVPEEARDKVQHELDEL